MIGVAGSAKAGRHDAGSQCAGNLIDTYQKVLGMELHLHQRKNFGGRKRTCVPLALSDWVITSVCTRLKLGGINGYPI